MKVLRASKAGFCMGVGLALQKLEKALEECSPQSKAVNRICTFGPIIHNPQVLEKFSERGVVCLESLASAKINDCVLIRAHGIPKQDEKTLRNHCANVIDATCPKVKAAQMAIAKATANNATLLLFGEFDHPEVKGLVSYAKANAYIFNTLEEIKKLGLDKTRQYVLASQTTQDREIFEVMAKRLRDDLPDLTVLSTICDATRERQEEALRLAKQVDVMVVTGGKESGNTRRLASLARQADIETWHVERADELKKEHFEKKSIAGLTAGASTPKSLIDEVENWLLKI